MKIIIYIKIIFKIIEEIGFQGKNPLTDFRGSGLLGLKHLWYFSINDIRSEQVFRIATGKRTWYYYAATGISISGKVIQFIEERDCDKYFYDNNNEINLYNEFFVAFNNMWIEKGYYDIMRVNSTLEEFMEHRAKLVFQRLILMKKVF